MEENNKRIVFLCSGGGGNLRFIKRAVDNGWLGSASIVTVLTDRECGANEFSRLHGIDNKCIDFTATSQIELIECLDLCQPDIVITNVHRIIRPDVIKKFGGKLINLHYSLLPAFGGSIGMHSVQKTIAYGAQFTGVTVHFVDESLDGGRPLFQTAIPLRGTDNVDSVMDLVFRCGCISLLASITSFLCSRDDSDSTEDMFEIKGRHCLFSKQIQFQDEMRNEALWEDVKLPK